MIYVRRWPIADQDATLDELQGEATPDLIEALETAGLARKPDSTVYRVIPGTVPFLEAQVKVLPPGDAPNVVQAQSYQDFDTWHAAQYHQRH